MTNAIAVGRAKLHTALKPLLEEGRVALYSAEASPTPRIVIGSPRLSLRTIDRNGTRWTYATFPVYVEVDGADRAQLVQLDELVSKVWDAAWTLTRGEPAGSSPSTVDLTGADIPSTRRQTVDIDFPIGQLTLCPPTTEDSP